MHMCTCVNVCAHIDEHMYICEAYKALNTYTTHLYIHQRHHGYIHSYICMHINTYNYIQATFYFACASTVAIFYFILFLLRCLHTSVHINTDVVNLEHNRNCIQVVQNVFSYIQMCIFNNIKLEMTCALIYLKCYTNTNKSLACVRVHETYKCRQIHTYAMYVWSHESMNVHVHIYENLKLA